MTFDRPEAWALLALAVPVVVLHLRFRRRRAAEVPSLALWRDLVPAGTGRRGLRRIEDLVQLAALLVALTAFTAALAGPVTGHAAAPTERLVIVLDVSASMNAVSMSAGSTNAGSTNAGGGTAKPRRSRFDDARAAASAALAKLGPGDEVVVWAASERPRVAIEPTTDLAAARDGLAEIRPTLDRSGIATTLDLARLALRNDTTATILVLTDAVGAEATARPAPDGARPATTAAVFGVAGGRDASNAGIVAGEVDGDDVAFGEHSLRLRVARTDGADVARTAVLLRDGTEVARVPVDPAADAATDTVLRLDAFAAGGFAEVRLEPADDFAPDDAVSFVIAPPKRFVVAVVAPGLAPSPFLVDALRAMPDRVNAERAILAQPNAPPAAFAAADVIVAEGALPFATPRDRPSLLFGAEGREVTRPVVWGTGRHPVLDGVDLAPLRIDRANVLDLAPADRVLIECAEGPVAVASDEGGVRRLRFGFRPDATTLPLEPAFPVLVRNALRWLGRPALLPPSVRAGAPIATSEPLPPIERAWFVGPGDLPARPVLVRDGAFVETAPVPPAGGSRRMTVRGLAGEPATAVNWFAPAGFRLLPERAAGATGTDPRDVASAVLSLADRRRNVDTRVSHAGLCALAGAAVLAAASLLLSRRGLQHPAAATAPIRA